MQTFTFARLLAYPVTLLTEATDDDHRQDARLAYCNVMCMMLIALGLGGLGAAWLLEFTPLWIVVPLGFAVYLIIGLILRLFGLGLTMF